MQTKPHILVPLSNALSALQCVDWAKIEKLAGADKTLSIKSKVEILINYYYHFFYRKPSTVEKMYLLAIQKEVLNPYKELFGNISPAEAIKILFNEVFSIKKRRSRKRSRTKKKEEV